MGRTVSILRRMNDNHDISQVETRLKDATRRLHQLSASVGGNVQERFDAKWMPEPYSGCWLWIGAIGSTGYGHLRVNRKVVTASRLSWTLHRGEIPDSLCVLHKCDVPSCVNPDHLYLGTVARNNQDSRERGQWYPLLGEKHGMSKLTEDDVLSIRASSETPTILSKRFNISPLTVWEIRIRKRWKHI